MTGLERHLLSAFERLEREYAARENDLHKALVILRQDFSDSLERTRTQVENTTKLCSDLTALVNDLSSQLESFQRILED